MKWIDSFLFNGEPIVQLRLAYLFPHVDTVYICEQRYTHQGQRKETLYIDTYKEWFAPYISKIRFLIDESEPLTNAWKSENGHRNFAATAIAEDYPTDPFLLICADVDEIPNIDFLLQEQDKIYAHASKGPVYLQQKMYYYNLHWFVHPWDHPFIINDILFRTGNTLQSYRDKNYQNATFIPCGWHFSYFMEREDILRKIESFAHTEYNSEDYKSAEYIDKCLMFGLDLYHRTWMPSFTREDPEEQGYPPIFLEFHTALLSRQHASNQA